MKHTLTIFCVAALAVMFFSSCQKNGPASGDASQASVMSQSDSNKAGTKRFYEDVMNNHKLASIDELCAANFVDHNPDPGHSGQGIDDLKKTMAEMGASFPDMHVTVNNMVAEGDMVAANITMTGTWKGDMMGMKANGKSFKADACDFLRIKDGKAVERWGVFDVMSMMRQLGMAPAPPSGAPAADKKM